MGPRMTNPANPVSWLYRMTPAEREQALEKLPSDTQERFRKNLAWFDGLPKEQQKVVLQRQERFAAMPPEKQRQFRQQLGAFNQLPQERRQMVQRALMRLQTMPDEQRVRVLNSDQFKSMFSEGEQKIIAGLSEIMPAPM